MQWRMPAHKAVASGAAVLLNILFVLLLIFATRIVKIEQAFREIPITIMILPPPAPKKAAEQAKLPPIAAPLLILPPLPKAPMLLTLPPMEQPDVNGLLGLGRYLFDCSAMNYELLSEREWQHCLANNFEPYDPGKAPRLGQEGPSPWTQLPPEVTGAPVGRPCQPDQPGANMGIPCYTEPPRFPYHP